MDEDMLVSNWNSSRSGAWAGRGFRYQDAVTALLALELWNGKLAALKIVPEGFDDISLESISVSTLIQIKSRNEQKKSFSNHEIKNIKQAFDKRVNKIELAGGKIDKKVILLERHPQNENALNWCDISSNLLKNLNTDTTDDFLTVVVSNPKNIATQIIQDKLSVLPATSEVVFHSI